MHPASAPPAYQQDHQHGSVGGIVSDGVATQVNPVEQKAGQNVESLGYRRLDDSADHPPTSPTKSDADAGLCSLPAAQSRGTATGGGTNPAREPGTAAQNR